MGNRTNELRHYGVKGMKWGVRKNRGGTSTSRSRFKSDYESPKGDRKRKVYTKQGYQLTDKELNRRIKRLSKEKQYQDLQREVNSTRMSSGRKAVSKALSSVGTVALTSIATYGVAKMINTRAGEPVMGVNVKGKRFPGIN